MRGSLYSTKIRNRLKCLYVVQPLAVFVSSKVGKCFVFFYDKTFKCVPCDSRLNLPGLETYHYHKSLAGFVIVSRDLFRQNGLQKRGDLRTHLGSRFHSGLEQRSMNERKSFCTIVYKREATLSEREKKKSRNL